MKRIVLLVVLCGMTALGLKAQTLTVHDVDSIGFSGIVFTMRNGEEVIMSFRATKTIDVPYGAIKFKIISGAHHRDSMTNKYTMQISTNQVPIMTFDDLNLRVTLSGSIHDARNAQLSVEEVD